MDCESCVAKVKPALLALGISDSLKFNMQSPDKTVEFVGTQAQKESVIAILKQLGYEAQELGRAPMSFASSANKSFFSIYKPLIIIGLFIIGITILVEIRAGNFDFMRAMNSFMGGFFLFFSFFKLLNLRGFVDAFTTYDVIAKKSRTYAFVYPFIELFLGMAFVLNVLPIMTNLITLLIMTIGNIGVWDALKKKQTIQCACLGTIFDLPMTKVTLFENSLMILMAITSLIFLVMT